MTWKTSYEELHESYTTLAAKLEAAERNLKEMCEIRDHWERMTLAREAENARLRAVVEAAKEFRRVYGPYGADPVPIQRAMLRMFDALAALEEK